MPQAWSGNLTELLETVNRLEREAAGVRDEARIVFLRNIAIEGIEPFLKLHLYRAGIRPALAYGGYGTALADTLGGDALVVKHEPSLIALAFTLEDMDTSYGDPGWRHDAIRAELERLFQTLADNTRATIAVNTFLPPAHSELGLMLAPDGSDLGSQVAALNAFVREYVRRHGSRFVLTDWEQRAALLGRERTIDARYWYLSRAPFRKDFLDAYARDLCRVVLAQRGRVRKCLALDCDNTLWGGIVGEAGVDGIELSATDYPGRAYFDFQRTILHLFERGVLIALCSKNNEADVFEVLDRHPACRLGRKHLAAHRINWEDKASNLIALAKELNLGLDAFVFVDDNPAECALIQQVLPQVAVLQVPERVHDLPALVLQDGWFDTLTVSSEDRRRAELYQTERLRSDARARAATLEDHLASLEMVASIHRARSGELPRVAQLTQKTNQFNFTTRRRSQAEIEALAADPDAAIFTLELTDRFSELGLVGVLIARRDGRSASIDTFLMSCRVLGRGVELVMLQRCFDDLRADWGVTRWHAAYAPTAKNGQIAEFWPQLGFGEGPTAADGTRTFGVDDRDLKIAAPPYITVKAA